jgi:hypothetical protein
MTTFYKHFLSLCIFSLILFSACSSEEAPVIEETSESSEEEIMEETTTDEPEETEEEEEVALDLPTEDKIYTIFSMNTHDWVFPERSIETLNKVIDIHEEYDVGVNIHISNPMLHVYLEQAPDLIERLKTSEVVAMATHLRPSSPFYNGFDNEGIGDMEGEEQYEAIKAYEEHRLNLETGLNIEDEPGGFEYMKEIFGYPPLIVGHTSSPVYGETLSKVYEEKGALFTAVNGGKDSNLGDMLHGLYIRPQHSEIKLYELAKHTQDGEEAFQQAIDGLPDQDGPVFIGMKYHENNFYTTGTPWWPVFWEAQDKSDPLPAPYDLTASKGIIRFKSEMIQTQHWDLYESTVAYAAENRDELNPVNAFDLKEMLGL